MISLDKQKWAELQEFKARTKTEIAEIEQWMLSSPKRPIYLKVGDSPPFAFRRFSDEEYLAIQGRLPKSEAEALELQKDPTANQRETLAQINDLEKCCLDPIKHESWLGMDWRDRLALWAELLKVAQQREEQVTKFRADGTRADVSENMLPLPPLPPVSTSPVST